MKFPRRVLSTLLDKQSQSVIMLFVIVAFLGFILPRQPINPSTIEVEVDTKRGQWPSESSSLFERMGESHVTQYIQQVNPRCSIRQPGGITWHGRQSSWYLSRERSVSRWDFVCLSHIIRSLKVDTLVSGEIDCEDFKLKLLCHKDKPAIINVNIGAVDDLDLVIQKLEETGFTHDRFYIHCDGALFGLMMPFVKRAPKVSFKKPIGSVSVSGHKFVGCPMPCGVQITRLEHINALSRNVEYLASRDATIMGSRNGHAPIFLWYTLNRKGYRGFRKEVQKCLRNAHYLKDRLRAARNSSFVHLL